MTLTIELNPDTELKLKKRATANGVEVEDYVTKLIEQDSNKVKTFDEILAPFRQSVEESGISDDELDELFTKARKEVLAEKKARFQE